LLLPLLWLWLWLLLLFLLEDFQYLSSIRKLSPIWDLHSDPEFDIVSGLQIEPETSLAANCTFLYLKNTRLHRSCKKKKGGGY